MLDLSRTWTLPDPWPADAFWNVARDPAAADLIVAAMTVAVIWFAVKTRKGMK